MAARDSRPWLLHARAGRGSAGALPQQAHRESRPTPTQRPELSRSRRLQVEERGRRRNSPAIARKEGERSETGPTLPPPPSGRGLPPPGPFRHPAGIHRMRGNHRPHPPNPQPGRSLEHHLVERLDGPRPRRIRKVGRNPQRPAGHPVRHRRGPARDHPRPQEAVRDRPPSPPQGLAGHGFSSGRRLCPGQADLQARDRAPARSGHQRPADPADLPPPQS